MSFFSFVKICINDNKQLLDVIIHAKHGLEFGIFMVSNTLNIFHTKLIGSSQNLCNAVLFSSLINTQYLLQC